MGYISIKLLQKKRKKKDIAKTLDQELRKLEKAMVHIKWNANAVMEVVC